MIVSIDNKLEMVLPEGFRKLSDKELRDRGAKLSDEGMVFWAEEEHVILQVFWKKLPLFGQNTPIEKSVDIVAQKHKKLVPGCSEPAKLEGTVAGLKAAGFSYKYTADATEQRTIYYGINYDKKVYGFSCTMRDENSDRDTEAFNSILKSVNVLQ